jgi:hypothetical protein
MRKLLRKIRAELAKEHRAYGRCVDKKNCRLAQRIREIDATLNTK